MLCKSLVGLQQVRQSRALNSQDTTLRPMRQHMHSRESGHPCAMRMHSTHAQHACTARMRFPHTELLTHRLLPHGVGAEHMHDVCAFMCIVA
jgi:hypothetical protein